MYKYQLTIGLFDRETETQLIPTEEAKKKISDILIDNYDVFAFTMIECSGVYKMESTGCIVYEPSIRVEIATENDLRAEYPENNVQDSAGNRLNIIDAMVRELKYILNQETIMIEISSAQIEFK